MLLTACSYDEQQDLYDVTVNVENLPTDQMVGGSSEGLVVKMQNQQLSEFSAKTDAAGNAHFRLPTGVYGVSIAEITIESGSLIVNGNIAQCVVKATDDNRFSFPLTITSRSANSLIIKEIYNGGCQKDDGSGIFAFDKCIILYNNSAYDMEVENLAIGMAEPYNAESSSHHFMNNGKLMYESESTLPLINGIWYFPDVLKVKAYEEVVVNVCGAIDNTLTYSNSINYANADYYCMYDPSTMGADGAAYANVRYYPSPAEIIPTSHYLKTVKYGKGNAWPYSQTSPATVVFQTKDITPKDYANDAQNIVYPTGKQGDLVTACLSIPRAWILDGVEIYNADKLPDCAKRLTADIDNGYALLSRGYGHALCRRIDREKTASAGHNVYVDTNNSSNDFIETESCSLKR